MGPCLRDETSNQPLRVREKSGERAWCHIQEKDPKDQSDTAPPKRSPCCLGIPECPSVHARTNSTVALPERDVWKWGLGPFLSLEDDVKRKNVGSSGLRTTALEGVMSSALLKPNFISGTWLKGGDGLEKADFSFPSSLTPFFVSGTDLGLKAVPMLSNKAGSSVVKELRGSPVSASGDTL